MILFFEWQDVRNYKNGIKVGVGCYILVLAHPNGVYTIAYLLLMTAVGFLYTPSREKYFNGIMTLLFPLSISLLLIVISYVKIFPEMLQEGMKWHDSPPTSISYILYIFTQYFAGDFYAWLSASFFIAGVLISYKYEKPVAVLLPSIFLPIILISIQGLSHFPWGYGRFLIFIVPVIIIFIAEGVSYNALKYFPNKSHLSTAVIVILLILTWTPHLATIFNEQFSFPWHTVASFPKSSPVNGILSWGAIGKTLSWPVFIISIIVMDNDSVVSACANCSNGLYHFTILPKHLSHRNRDIRTFFVATARGSPLMALKTPHF